MLASTSFQAYQTALENSQLPDATLLDNPERVRHASLWQRIIQNKAKRKLDHSAEVDLKRFFQNRYGFNDSVAFNRAWKTIVGKTWTKTSPISAGTIRTIDKAFKSRLVYHGPGIQPPEIPISGIDKIVHEIVQALMHGGKLSKNLLQKKLIKAIFVKKDANLLAHLREGLQHELNALAASPPKKPQEEIMWRAFLGNVIGLLPFTYPSTNDIFEIPCLENGTCRMVKYHIEVLPLHYPGVTSPMTALGFTPVDDKKANPLISFIGTTFPAGDGHMATLLSDFTPKHSVGELVYKHNKKTIEEWFKDKKNVHAVGISLGGAMTFHAYRHQHERLARVDVYNPPGLYKDCWHEEIKSNCPVNIYCQSGDFVSFLGEWPKSDNVSLYSILQHQMGVKENVYSSHVRVFTGCETVTIIKKDPKEVNASRRRQFLTRLHQCLGPFIIYLPLKFGLWLYQQIIKIKNWACGFFCHKPLPKS